MTTAYVEPIEARGSQGLQRLLRAAHRLWIQETEEYLQPLTLSGASFWDRLTALRYMADQFERQYRRERALLGHLREFLPPSVAEPLTRNAEGIGQIQRELDRVGRRRGTSISVSVIARSLLDAQRAWCTDLESAADRIQREAFPDAAKGLIEDFELYVQTKA